MSGSASKLLSQHANLTGIFALDDVAGKAVLEALKSRHGKKPMVVSFGGSPELTGELRSKTPLELEIAVFPRKIGERAVALARRLVTNRATPNAIWLPPRPYTKENASSYPGLDGEPATDLTIPWKTDLVLELKRDE
jgi:ABC-type sugar transport system substrate-binding protein